MDSLIHAYLDKYSLLSLIEEELLPALASYDETFGWRKHHPLWRAQYDQLMIALYKSVKEANERKNSGSSSGPESVDE